MKFVVSALVFFIALIPLSAFADCNNQGYTVVYVNGIFTDTKAEADHDKNLLEQKFDERINRTDVTFLTGYNQSHLGGLGDLIKSVEQAYESDASYIEDYDLKTILLQLYPEITTKKILLVGHSQGTFYTNALYDYLTKHGIPKSAIGVFNIATPADYVAGEGNYLTSATDLVIEKVRELAAAGHADEPLSSNILIRPGDMADMEGHSFSGAYLAGASGRVVGDIQNALGKLSVAVFSDPSMNTTSGGCFTPPPATFSYKAESVAFAVADPAAVAVRPAVMASGKKLVPLAEAGYSALAAAGDALSSAVGLATSWIPPANEKTAVAAFPIAKALYGSGLNENDVADLNNIPLPASAQQTATPPPSVPHLSDNHISPQTPIPSAHTSAPSPSISPLIPNTPAQISITPGFGGGGGGPPSPPPAPIQPPEPPLPSNSLVLRILSPDDGSLFSTSSILFSGTTTPNNFVEATAGSQDATTTADSSGAWSLPLTFPEGSTTASVSAFDSVTQSTTTLTRAITVDTTPPAAPTLSIAECSASLSASGCLIASTTATLSWDAISDAAEYAVAAGGAWLSTTTATSATATVPDQTTSLLAIVVLDAAGNAATSSALSLAAYLHPVVINEVAWAGTTASSSDQWLELRNRTFQNIDLSRLALSSGGGSISIPLSGVINADSASNPGTSDYYLIERNSQVTNASANLINAFAPLSQSGDQLILSTGAGASTTILDETPPLSACGGWCAGALSAATGFSVDLGTSSLNSLSMERLDASVDGALASNWASNDMYTAGGSDRSGEPVEGTPGSKNSSHLADAAFSCDANNVISGSATSTYRPQSSTCTYYSRFISHNEPRYGGLFRGQSGSSTPVNIHSLGWPLVAAENNDTIPSDASAGDDFFVAIFETPPSPRWTTAVQDFVAFFETGSTTSGLLTPPHQNYRVIPFVLGN